MTTGEPGDWFRGRTHAPQYGPGYGTPPPNPYANPHQGGFGVPGHGAPGYGAPGYGAPGYGAPGGGAPARNGMGIAALVLGGLALVFSWTILGGFIFGVLGVVLAGIHNARVRQQRATGRGMGVTALVLGIIGIAISAILFAVGAWLFGTRSQNYLDCVNNANGNQQEIRRCVDRYLTNP